MAFRYLLFNKPFNVLSQFTGGATPPEKGTPRRTLADFIPVKDVYPVGRLDFDSEGLLLLTGDGRLQHRLSDPRFEHARTYWVQVEGQASSEALKRMEEGLHIQDYWTKPCKSRLMDPPDILPRDLPIRVRRKIPTSWVEVTLREGRNRQVRRMTAAIGLPTLRLFRAGIGDLTSIGLAPGQWRDLSPIEQSTLISNYRP